MPLEEVRRIMVGVSTRRTDTLVNGQPNYVKETGQSVSPIWRSCSAASSA
ncbi:hypothetical protein LNP74_10615 [Klebsiella pneumoniae subsp. pneumoniae]|nr:hypothetical protein [Klebsiella pneumoniae subsp. pneumoniae]